MTVEERGARASRGLWATGALCLLVGTLLLVPTAYYTYLSLNPPEMRPGDLYLGGTDGLVLALVFAVPAAVLFLLGALLVRRTRPTPTRGHRALST